jgi:glycosyltransferase involved in cell wall biosynthesis
MKRKVLIITTTFKRWKNDVLPSFVYDFAQSIKGIYDVHILAPHTVGAKVNEDIDGCKVYRFVYAPTRLEKFGAGISIVSTLKNNPRTAFLIPFFIISASVKIVKLQLYNKFDVIHVNWLVPFGPVVGLIRIFSNFRYVITAHGSDVFPFVDKKGILITFVKKLHRIFTLPKADWIVPVSTSLREAIAQLLPTISQDKTPIISMGINFQHFSNLIQRDAFHKPLRIVFVGRLAEIKGVKYLISAMNILKQRNIEFELRVYGDGLLLKELRDQVDKLNLSHQIFFNGFVEHNMLPGKLAEADIFVGPSITTSLGEAEGLGLVFLEAMASGLVVIASKVGGISDIVIDRKTGILVNEKDPDAIVDAIELLIRDEKIRKSLIENGKILAKEYDWAFIAKRYSQIYEIEL